MNTRINNNASLQYLSTRSLSEAPGKNPASSGGKPVEQDSFRLSQTGGQLTSLTQLATQSSGMDNQRIEAIRDAISSGQYPLDADKVAARMLDAERLLEA